MEKDKMRIVIFRSYHDLSQPIGAIDKFLVTPKNSKDKMLHIGKWELKSKADKFDVVVMDSCFLVDIFMACKFVGDVGASGDKADLVYEKRIKAIDEYAKGKKMLEASKRIAEKATCKSRKIGAVVYKNGMIVGRGYNGPPVGECGEECPRQKMGYKSGEGMLYCPSIHTEQRAVMNAGQKANGATIYMTCSLPCYRCMASIKNAGIKKIVCAIHTSSIKDQNDYMFDKSLELAQKHGIEIVYYRVV